MPLVSSRAEKPPDQLRCVIFIGNRTMRICAVSPHLTASQNEILQFLSSCNHDLVVLPGNAENQPSYLQVAKALKLKVSAFVETGSRKSCSVPWLVSSEHCLKMPSQVFAVKPSASDLDRLQSIWPERTHKIRDKRVSFAICGEIDGFKKDGSVKMGRYLPYEVLINPTHTTRGRWNHLGEKLTNLSSGTAVVHVANNNYNHHRVTTDVRIYVDGIVMERHIFGNLVWSECEI